MSVNPGPASDHRRRRCLAPAPWLGVQRFRLEDLQQSHGRSEMGKLVKVNGSWLVMASDGYVEG